MADYAMVNLLGMPFVAIPGTKVLFAVYPTRLKDWRTMPREELAKSDATLSQGAYHPAGFSPPVYAQDGNHAVNFVSWWDAKTFCAWLSREEGRTYRLPTDHEWSCASGIGHLEDPTAAPREKSLKVSDLYPWGDVWPPPAGSGNFRGEECARLDDATRREAMRLYHVSARRNVTTVIPTVETDYLWGYDDGYPFTSPVGIFAPSELGIHDLAGNVTEWCEDKFFPEDSDDVRVLRGSSFCKWEAGQLNVSRRYKHNAKLRYGSHGFRLAVEP